MTTQWQPYSEPLRNTMLRNSAIAIVGGTAIALLGGRRIPLWAAILLMLWPSFGGHFLEVWFLNWLRPRLSSARSVQVAARLGTWFAGGTLLAMGMVLTASVLTGSRRDQWPAWWVAGIAFIGIELIAHLAPQFSGRSSFYNGRG
jgi:hypothetical protein